VICCLASVIKDDDDDRLQCDHTTTQQEIHDVATNSETSFKGRLEGSKDL